MKKINIFSLVTGILGALCLLVAAIPIILVLTNFGGANDIGVIGGADTPTAIHVAYVVMDGWPVLALWLGVPLILTSLFTVIFKKTTANCLTVKTSVTAILISAMCGAGAGCFINCFLIAATGQMHKHPIQYPWSVAGTTVAFVAILGLLALYIFKLRAKNPSGKGIAIDMLTAAVYFPFMFLAFLHFAEWLTWAVNVILS